MAATSVWRISLLAMLLAAGCAHPGDGPSLGSATPAAPVDPAPVAAGGDANPEVDIEAYIQQGSGQRVATGLPGLHRWDDQPAGVAFSFQNAEIRGVAAAILGDALNLPYAIEKSAEGKISFETNGLVARPALLFAFESALEAVGVRLIDDHGVYRLVAAKHDAGHGRLVGLNPQQLRAGYGVGVIPLRFASAPQIKQLLTPFIPTGVRVEADGARNLLLIAGSGPERLSLLDLITVFDVDWMSGMSYALLPLSSGEPKAVIAELEAVFATLDKAGAGSALKLLPVERLNAVLAIAPDRRLIEEVRNWVDRLDAGSDGAGRRLYVYNVQNGRAGDLAAVLGGVFAAEPPRGGVGDDGGIAPGLSPITLTDGGKPGEAMAAPAARPAETSYANDRLRIVADERANALVVLATAQDYRLIRSSLDRLDVPALQVLIEATIAEVTLNDELRYGLQWFFRSGDFDFSLSNVASGAVDSNFPGFSGVFDSGSDVRTVIDALDSVTDLNVISSPQLMVLNNQTATLQVGDEVPVPIRSAVSVNDPSAPVVNSIEFRSTGVILRVTPRVNANGMVLLDIEQEVSDVVPTRTSGIDAPTIQQRRISSTIAVRSNETIALGGLIQDRSNIVDSGVPLVKDIPLLGNLFKTRSNTTRRTELLILITPKVVGNLAEARAVTDELRQRMQAIKIDRP